MFISFAGGVNLTSMNAGERMAIGWHYYYKSQNATLKNYIFSFLFFSFVFSFDLMKISHWIAPSLVHVTD